MNILGIETSCDETAVAVVKDGREVLSNVVYTQIPIHKKYGGVVPEVASRLHCENIVEVYEEAIRGAGLTLNDIEAISVTYAPGLIGALLTGVSFAKALAYSTGKPLIPVHHIRGHIATNYIAFPELEPPFIALAASGGHTQIIKVKGHTEFELIGETTDDAVGEAFDKAARVLGFPYPGGKYLDIAAQKGDKTAYKFTKPNGGKKLFAENENPFDFSFSGLKTAVVNLVHNITQKDEKLTETQISDIAASFQETVSEILSEKLELAAKKFDVESIVVCGGVAANSGVRKAISGLNYKVYIPPVSLCGDNGAMIASQGFYEYKSGIKAGINLNAYPRVKI